MVEIPSVTTQLIEEAKKHDVLSKHEEREIGYKIAAQHEIIVDVLCSYQWQEDGQTYNGLHLVHRELEKAYDTEELQLNKGKRARIRELADLFNENPSGPAYDHFSALYDTHSEVTRLLSFKTPRVLSRRPAKALLAQMKQDGASDEYKALARAIRAEERYTTRLFNANIRFAKRMAMNYFLAWEYSDHPIQIDDAIQEAAIGMMTTVERFDPHEDVRLISYARWWIRSQLQAHRSSQSQAVSMARGGLNDMGKMLEIREEVQREHGRSASLKEVGKRLNLTEDGLKKRQSYLGIPIPLDAPISREENADTYLDCFVDTSTPDFASVEGSPHSDPLGPLLAKLSVREEKVLRMRHGILHNGDRGTEHTLDDIAKPLNLTRERIRQIEAAAMGKLRDKTATHDFRHAEFIRY